MARKHVNKGMAPDKGDLPTKACAACARPFAWRKKWARDWEGVKFCSDACRRKARKTLAPFRPPVPADGPGRL